jgi:hypothetical protein
MIWQICKLWTGLRLFSQETDSVKDFEGDEKPLSFRTVWDGPITCHDYHTLWTRVVRVQRKDADTQEITKVEKIAGTWTEQCDPCPTFPHAPVEGVGLVAASGPNAVSM